MLLVQPVLLVIVIGAVEAIIVMQEAAFLVTQVTVLIDVITVLGIMYPILAVPLLILLAQQVPTVIVFGVIQVTIAHQGLVLLDIQAVALIDVTMDPGSINHILVVLRQLVLLYLLVAL